MSLFRNKIYKENKKQLTLKQKKKKYKKNKLEIFDVIYKRTP